MEVRDKAFADWKKGMKYKEIAEKYNVSLSAVKTWATRHWKKEGVKQVATKKNKKLQPSSTELQPKRRRGAPEGNKNAKGNTGGAPQRNQNNIKHGAYAKIYWDSLDENELELLNKIDYEGKYQLERQIDLYTIRERRLLVRIKEYKELSNKTGGLTVKGVIKEKGIEKGKSTNLVKTEMEAVMNSIMLLESELTKVQKAKTKAIDSLTRLRIENRKLDDVGKGNELVDDWISSIMEELPELEEGEDG